MRTRLVLLNKRFVNKSNLSHTCQHFHLKTEEFLLVIWKEMYIKEVFVGKKPFPSGKVIKNLGSNLNLQFRIGPLLESIL